MAKHILIDSYFGLVRTAIAQGGKLLDYYEESPDHGRSKGNIYKGIVKKVDSHIQAAFVKYGGGRDGFLPLRDISSRSCETDEAGGSEGEEGGAGGNQRGGLKPGDSVLVQVVKDEVGGKGAALTTKLSLSGRYLVYLPVRGGEGGISSRVSDEDRAALKKSMSELQLPPGGCVILRTAALNKTAAELQADLDRLDEAYREIRELGAARKEPGLVYREAPPALRYLREYYMPDVERIHVNQEDVLEQCRQFFHLYEPKAASKVVLSPDGPLMFQKLGLEAEVERLASRKVLLPSGANFVIDQTEALVAIDVNSAKSGGAGPSGSRGESNGSGRGEERDGEEERGDGRRRRDLEETVFAINMEAAGEIARQLRLRDLGGIIIVDFIDMEEERHRRKVEEAMRRALASDKAKIKVYDITPLGIMQISRQRLRKAGPHFSRSSCESCQGRGWHASPAAAAFSALRRMEEKLQSRKGYSSLAVTVPYPVANHLLNEFRRHVLALEERHGAIIRILADPAPAGEPAFSVQSIEGGDGRPAGGSGKAGADTGTGERTAEPKAKGRGKRARDRGHGAPEAVSAERPFRKGPEGPVGAAAEAAVPAAGEPVIGTEPGIESGMQAGAVAAAVEASPEPGEGEARGTVAKAKEQEEGRNGIAVTEARTITAGDAEPEEAGAHRRDGGGRRSRRGRGRKGGREGREGRAGGAQPQAEPRRKPGKPAPAKAQQDGQPRGQQSGRTGQAGQGGQGRGGKPGPGTQDGGRQKAPPAQNAGKDGQGRSTRRGRNRQHQGPRQGEGAKEAAQPVAARPGKGPIEY